jgi:hypothetical protein
MLDRRHRALLPEWLVALAASGRRPPDAALPALLDLARSEPELRRPVVAALGSRGRWLADLNPAWSFVAGAASAQDEAALHQQWQTGGRNGRLFLLETLRAERPELARALLESTWTSERAEERAAFLAALGPGLSDEDEPFLERALDDRSREVRATAAALLARLPRSRLARRMAARALGLVQYRGGLMPTIEARLPEQFDTDLLRDGIDPKPLGGLGERAWWLSAIIRRTPPAVWSEAWGRSPAKIVGTRIAGEWRQLLLEAWAQAAISYANRAWAAALAELSVREPQTLPPGELLATLPQPQRELQLIALLGHGRQPLGRDHPALDPLRTSPRPWGQALARAVLGAIARRFAQDGSAIRGDWQLRSALDDFALAIPHELAEAAIAALPVNLSDQPFWSEAVTLFAERLRLRQAMHAALRADAPYP